MTDRGVSVMVNYVLGLAILTLLISGLLIATGDVIGDRREAIVRGELEVVGERVSAGLATADRLSRSGAEQVSLDVSAPRRVAGTAYTIEIDAARQVVVLETSDPAVTVDVTFRNRTAVETTNVTGGDVEIVLSDGNLEVRSS